MNHAALLLALFCSAAACGAPAPRPPTVTVGEAPTEVVSAANPARMPAAVVDAASQPAAAPSETHGERAELIGHGGLFLTDGEGRRFDVETIQTIQTISPSPTR
ncbi:MAG TPA: hypothetical protein ENK57_06205 [Polyangiaceae bacterium]|nr:hypothetical protein [Polyangiaceae bacterium]